MTTSETSGRGGAGAERAEEQLALKNSQCERAERAAAGALAERDALAKDKARLDWLLDRSAQTYHSYSNHLGGGNYVQYHKDRAAIDAAMKGTT